VLPGPPGRACRATHSERETGGEWYDSVSKMEPVSHPEWTSPIELGVHVESFY
jgi:hypothetical protein